MSVFSSESEGGKDPTSPSTNPFPLIQSCHVRFQDPFELYGLVTGYAPHSFFIEHDSHQSGISRRFSYLGCNPYRVLKGKDHTISTYTEGIWEKHVGDPLSFLEQQFKGDPLPMQSSVLPFLGGAVGCFSYDLARTFEALPTSAEDDLHFPDIYVLFVEVFVVVDHLMSCVWLVFSPSPERIRHEPFEDLYQEGQLRLLALKKKLEFGVHVRDGEMMRSLSFCIQEGQSAATYRDRVRDCQQFIAAGDIYQANLSHRFQVENITEGFSSPAKAGATLYRQLRCMNPSPHSAFFVLESDVIVCNSPERLVRMSEGYADMRPIAGTRHRGGTPAEDRRLAEELLSNSKERAEHVMLVDLVRNDLGRACHYGSIRVDEFMIVERYSHVMHLVSHVLGRLRDEVNAFDLIRAVFPGGTITGVPKVHCMELVERLEPVRRGLYTGSIGFIGWNGNMDLNIVIRTLLISKNHGYLQVGAGIVADSDPDREYEETLHKAQAFMQVLQHVHGL